MLKESSYGIPLAAANKDTAAANKDAGLSYPTDYHADKSEMLDDIVQSYLQLCNRYPLVHAEGVSPIYNPKGLPMSVASFTSNSGAITSTAVSLQNLMQSYTGESPFNIVFMFSDSKYSKGSNHFFESYNLNTIAKDAPAVLKIRDINDFYRSYGYNCKTDSQLTNEEKVRIRQSYDEMTVKDIAHSGKEVNLVMFDYYWSLCTSAIYSRFITINSHLGDLSAEDGSGKRILAGFYPVRNAILRGDDELYSTTHIVDEKADHGKLLIRSAPLHINLSQDAKLLGFTLPKGREIEFLNEPSNEPIINDIEDYYESKMRLYCDSHILPLTVLLMSEGRFGSDKEGNIYFNGHQYDKVLKIDRLNQS